MIYTFDPMIFIAAGALCGGFINGLAGFGTSLFALGWFLQVLAPVEAVAMSLILSVLSGLPGMWIVRKHLVPGRLATFILPALLGIPLGLYLLALVNADQLKISISLFLLIYGVFFLSRSELPTTKFQSRVADGTVGFTGGILGALAGLSGALPTIWLSLKPWEKLEQRAVLQPFNVTILGLSAILLAINGGFDSLGLREWTTAIPFTIMGSFIGINIFRRLNNNQFKRLIIFLTTLSGAILFISAVS